jgi:hypothetical protein
MVYLQLLFAVAFPAVLGVCFVNIFLSKPEDASLMERTALGYCSGAILITLEMFFLLSKFNIQYSFYSIVLPLLPIIIFGVLISVKNKTVQLKFSGLFDRLVKMSPAEKLLIALIVFQVVFVATSTLIKPVSGWDAWQRYSLRAKAGFVDHTSNLAMLPSEPRGQHVPLMQTWAFICVNEWQEIIGKTCFPLFYISLLAMFYCAVRRYKDRLISLITTFMLSSLPFLVYHATLEYCDIILAIYLFAGVSLLYVWLNNAKVQYLLLSLFFLFSTVTIKPEAFLHLTIILSVFAVTIFSRGLEQHKYIKIIRNITLAGIAIGAVFICRMVFFVPQESLFFSPVLKFSRIPALFQVFGEYLFVRSNWGIIWSLLIVLCIFNFNKLKERFNLSLLMIVVLELFGFMGYYFSQLDWVYNMLFYVTPAVRNILQFMPIVVFLCAALLTIDMPEFAVSKNALPQNKIKAHKK